MALLELSFTLRLGLSPTGVELLAINLLLVELVNSLPGGLVVLVVDETETLGDTLLVPGKGNRDGGTEGLDQVLEFSVSDLEVNVLDVDVGKLGTQLLDLGETLLLADVVTNVNLLVVQKHTVDGLDGSVGGLTSRVVDEARRQSVTAIAEIWLHSREASALAILIGTDLARKNVTESSKGVVESLVVNALVEVLDENVSLTSLPQSGVTLRPHDSARLTLDERVVEVLEGPLTVGSVKVVDVGVTERSSSDGVTANTDASKLVSNPI